MEMPWRNSPIKTLAAAGAGAVTKALAGRVQAADLSGEVALITGGSRGLGLALAREFGRAGCKIAICARDGDELAQAGVWLAHEGVEAFTVPCDMTDEKSVKRMLETVTRHYGRVDILVNNAGVIQVGPALTMTRKDYQEAMDLMFWGVYNATQAVLPQMLDRGCGRIVNITSVGGKVSVPHLLPYACAKFAATGFSEGLHAALAAKGIAVTTIVPGELRTGSFEHAQFRGRTEEEFRWFAVSSSLPLMSMDADRAAHQILVATQRGEAERILSLPAAVLARFNGLFPGITAELLGTVNRLLPSERPGSNAREAGSAIHSRTDTPLLQAITRFGRSAARRFNENGHGHAPSEAPSS